MTHDIFSPGAASDRSHVVPLRATGAGSPLFCFPGSSGNADLFQEMVSALPVGQPVYAIDMGWLGGTSQDLTVEQLAGFYLDAIRNIQRKGPYYFCGYSLGGLVAYEIAVRLIDEGDEANLVSLLDAPNPTLMSNLSKTDSAQFHKTYLIGRVRKYYLRLVRGDIKSFTRNALSFIVWRLRVLFIPMIRFGFRIAKKPLPRNFGINDVRFLDTWRSYIPKSYAKDLVFFRAQDRGPEYDRYPTMGWDAYARGGVQVHIVPGGHLDMMKTPSVHFIAEKMAAYLDYGSGDGESAETF